MVRSEDGNTFARRGIRRSPPVGNAHANPRSGTISEYAFAAASAAQSIAVVCGWAVVLFAAGVVVLRRRDV